MRAIRGRLAQLEKLITTTIVKYIGFDSEPIDEQDNTRYVGFRAITKEETEQALKENGRERGTKVLKDDHSTTTE